MDPLGLIRCGGQARPDGPQRLIGDNDLLHLLFAQPGQTQTELFFNHFEGLFVFPLLKGFSDADDWLKVMLQS